MGKKKKRQVTQQRRYDGAERGRLFSDWVGTTNASADAELWSDLATLRSRSRDLLRNSDFAKGAVISIVNAVLGDYGIRFQSKIRKPRGEIDTKTCKEIEQLWRRWANNPKFCHAGGQLSWREIERLCLRSVIESGEVLIRKIPIKFGRSPVAFAIEIIECDQLADNYSLVRAENGNEIRMGVELDKWHRPVAYHLYERHPGDILGAQGSSQKTIRYPADEIEHLYISDRPNQTRGVPWLAASIKRIRNMSEFEEALTVKKRAQACISGVITTPLPDSMGVPDENPTRPSQISMEPGGVKTLAPGESFEGFSPGGSDTEAPDFIKHLLRGISSGLGIGYSTISHDYADASYSSHRAEKLQELTTLRQIQQWLIESLHQCVFSAWLDAAVMGGAIALPGYDLLPEKYEEAMWMAPGFAWIDPQKDSAASITSIKAGLSTLSIELASRGYDTDEVLEQLAQDKALAEKHGLSLPDIFGEPPDPDSSAPVQPGLVPVRGNEDLLEFLIAQNKELWVERSIYIEQLNNLTKELPPEYGLTAIPRLGNRAAKAKKCKAKPCGNSCIATSKACLADLTPDQLKLAKQAKTAMGKGKVGPSSDLPAPQADPAQKTPKTSAAKKQKEPSPTSSEKEQIDPILHDFYDHIKLGGKLTPEETMLAENELNVANLEHWKQSKVDKLKEDKLSPLEAAAVGNYIGDGYGDMNAAIYGSDAYQLYHGVEAWKAQMAINKAAASGMAKIPSTTEADLIAIGYNKGDPMIRSEKWTNEAELKAYIKKHEEAIKTGKPLVKEQFLSTTFNQEGLDYFSQEANVTIVVKAKTDGTGNSILVDKYKNKAFEAEVLYRPMSSFKVTKIEKTGGKKATKKEVEVEEFTPKYHEFKKALDSVAEAKSIAKWSGSSVTGALNDHEKKMIQPHLPKGTKISDLNNKEKFSLIQSHLDKLFQSETKKTKKTKKIVVTPPSPAQYKIFYEEV